VLQRLFSTFPGGRPGIGLLLLRATLGGIAIALGALELAGLSQRTPMMWMVACLLILSGGGLIAGFLTPFASLLASLCVLAITLSWVPGPTLAPVGATLLALLMIVTGLGIALLGPGAFSVDGLLFGRREIVIPPRTPEA
jgi:uncharacterized membrane protein YphA (DoxX/SURF4 family)